MQVYEKLLKGTWVFNGTFDLIDACQESDSNRSVYKFILQMSKKLPDSDEPSSRPVARLNDRVIPSDVKREVYKRDGGQCVKCHRKDNLHFYSLKLDSKSFETCPFFAIWTKIHFNLPYDFFVFLENIFFFYINDFYIMIVSCFFIIFQVALFINTL